MSYEWQDKEVTNIWKRITDIDAKLLALENKPTHTDEIQKLGTRIDALENARVVQIKLNHQFKLHNHEVKEVKEIKEVVEESWLARFFK